MSNTSPFRLPSVDPRSIAEVADGLWVLPDLEYVPMLPNIGIVVGARATLIIDTGFGPENARTVLREARRLGGDNPVFLTHTHCHPEHGFGANVIAGEVTILYNEVQWSELQEKGTMILRMFRHQMPGLAPMLDGVEFVRPNILYSRALTLDLGGPVVEFREAGGGHSRGDQAILVHSNKSTLFVGDLIEERHFGVMADDETHVRPWIEHLKGFERIAPDIVVPGHGHLGGPKLITEYREHFEFANRRFGELRRTGDLPEMSIVGRVTAELLDHYQSWGGTNWANKIVDDLAWPSRM